MSKFAEYAPRAPGDARAPGASGVVVRTVRADDAPQIAALVAQRESLDLAVVRPRIVEEIASIGAGAARALWVAETGGRVVAYARALLHERPSDASANAAPSGWYLMGVIVDPAHRRRGIGEALTRARIGWLRGRTDAVRYFANARNRPTIDLHARLGFTERTRDFSMPGATFEGGVGILFELRF